MREFTRLAGCFRIVSFSSDLSEAMWIAFRGDSLMREDSGIFSTLKKLAVFNMEKNRPF